MWQQLFWPPFLNKNIFFQFYFKILNVFMFSYFKPNFIEKFRWKSLLFKKYFGHVTVFATRFFFCCRHFETEDFFWIFCGCVCVYVLIYGYLILRCIHIWCEFHTEIPTEKILKNGRVLCAQTGVKSNLGTWVLNVAGKNLKMCCFG